MTKDDENVMFEISVIFKIFALTYLKILNLCKYYTITTTLYELFQIIIEIYDDSP